MADRRPADRHQLGVDLPDQRARRSGRAPRSRRACCRTAAAGRAARLRPGRRAVGDRGAGAARLRPGRGARDRLGRPAHGRAAGRGGRPAGGLRRDRVARRRPVAAAARAALAHAGHGQRRDAAVLDGRLRDAVHPHALRAAGAGLLPRRVRAHVDRVPGHGHGRGDRRAGPGGQTRVPPRRRGRNGAARARVPVPDAGLSGRELLRRHLPRAVDQRPGRRPDLRHLLDRCARRHRGARGRTRRRV